MQLSRRALIKVLGLTPMAANMVGQHLEMIASSGQGLLGGDEVETPCEVAGSKAEDFHSAISWWNKHGEKEIRERAHHVNGFDADILSMYSPLQFKVQLQRGRNFERLKARRWSEVEQTLRRNGVFRWWP